MKLLAYIVIALSALGGLYLFQRLAVIYMLKGIEALTPESERIELTALIERIEEQGFTKANILACRELVKKEGY